MWINWTWNKNHFTNDIFSRNVLMPHLLWITANKLCWLGSKVVKHNARRSSLESHITMGTTSNSAYFIMPRHLLKRNKHPPPFISSRVQSAIAMTIWKQFYCLAVCLQWNFCIQSNHYFSEMIDFGHCF